MTSISSPRRRWKYDVFISFRGEDTRYGFTGHLHRELISKGIHIFIDSESLQKGESISEVFTAIEESRCALVVLSKNFASSSWCLNEVVKIMQCRKELGQRVIPIFYKVEPSDVRNQRGSFQLRKELQVEVTEHEEIYGANEKKEWAAALTQLASLGGYTFKGDRTELEFLDSIVHEVFNWLNRGIRSSSVDKGFIGMDSRIADLLHNYIRPQSDGVRIIGIHGMRGIGKTTLALAIHDEIGQDFDKSCILLNVRERSLKDGRVSLQEQLLINILEEKIDIQSEYAGATMIKRRLCKRKVLVVIDDADDITHLEQLAGSCDWFGPGSRILVTTTNIRLLKAHGVDARYEATGLEGGEAIQLLSLKAFKKSVPPDDYQELCGLILQYAKGLPLALVVLGSFLCGRSTKEWESALHRLKNTPKPEIIDVLKISYDGLEEKDREIFLHIACFYRGKDRDRVTQILDYCDLNPVIGLSVLAERSLITVYDNEVSMHDLLQEMGWEIVRRESRGEPGERSRLWSHIDIDQMLKKNTGTKHVKGMVMELPKSEVAQWNPEAFSKLSQLSLLHIRNVNLPKGLTCLSNSLKLLEWTGCPLRSLPQNFESDELVELSLCHSNIEQLWKGTKNFDQLKFIKLRHSRKLLQTPDLTGVQNLETLDLEGCYTLVELHQSLGQLKKLIVLNLKDCQSLKSLPSKIELESLRTFILSNCSKVNKIPEFAGNMEHLAELCLDETAIDTLPMSIGCLNGLASLNLSNCRNLVCLPSTFSNLVSLKKLNLSGCLKLGEQDSARESGAIRMVVNHLTRRGCEVVGKYLAWALPSRLMQKANIEPMTMQLPLSDLCNLTDLNISNCNLGDAAFANFPCFRLLVALNLSGNNLVKLPSTVRSCSNLQNINLENCKALQELSGLPSNTKLDVRADGCSALETLFDLSNFSRLEKSYFNFISCFKLNDNQGCTNIAFEMLRIFLNQGISSEKETFEIVIPGSRIPNWFDHQSFGSSLTVDLLPGWNKSSFLGFVLCAVFVLHEHGQVDELDICRFKNFKATHHLVCCLKLNGRELQVQGKQPAFRFSQQFCQVESDHQWIFYVSRDKYFGTDWWNSCSQLEFLFKTKGLGLMVKVCGVHLIYEQDMQELNQIMTRVEGETGRTGTRTCTLEEL